MGMIKVRYHSREKVFDPDWIQHRLRARKYPLKHCRKLEEVHYDAWHYSDFSGAYRLSAKGRRHRLRRKYYAQHMQRRRRWRERNWGVHILLEHRAWLSASRQYWRRYQTDLPTYDANGCYQMSPFSGNPHAPDIATWWYAIVADLEPPYTDARLSQAFADIGVQLELAPYRILFADERQAAMFLLRWS